MVPLTLLLMPLTGLKDPEVHLGDRDGIKTSVKADLAIYSYVFDIYG